MMAMPLGELIEHIVLAEPIYPGSLTIYYGNGRWIAHRDPCGAGIYGEGATPADAIRACAAAAGEVSPETLAKAREEADRVIPF